MINTPKKNSTTKNEFQLDYVANSLMKMVQQKIERWIMLKNRFKEGLIQKINSLQKMDGISFWKINWKLNRLAVKGIPEETLKNGKIVISLPKKQSIGYASPYEKKFIEKTINELEGFDNLRLSQFHSYTPIYLEKKNGYDIVRWIEIEITEL
ncbi:hypothetical protein [Pseudoneobacillus sp. C159]